MYWDDNNNKIWDDSFRSRKMSLLSNNRTTTKKRLKRFLFKFIQASFKNRNKKQHLKFFFQYIYLQLLKLFTKYLKFN